MDKVDTSNHFTVTHGMQRLDSIVFAHYGDLTMFDDVLAANHSIQEVNLAVGTVIYLPEKVIKQTDDVLW